MSEQGYPVTVAVRRPDGRVEQVRVGTAYRQGEGFTLSMGELFIGGAPEATPVSAQGPAARRGSSGGGAGEVTTLPNYGRSKGAPIHGATLQDLEYYANGARRSLADPSKARWHDKERALLAAIEAEIARQRGDSGEEEGPGGGVMDDREPPPPTDDDNIPF